ncbi:hypothetical protein ACTJJ0_34435 [Chitinophaga sp. 22321]|uniref:AAA domain-containing protein n=1 Tax=Chitinophaga hostae TaxID=2831022 RepID=A0ABS5JB37_9BACT|nr:hypothetical protein [Chitinophaga hostae]MBS0032416.1 hypothetical protein [Chitinophaga hostae]
MQINSIEITNVKGIAHQVLDLGLLPNKPNVLVAPNGFGKSSLSIGFASLKKSKLELDDNNYYLNNKSNKPILSLTIQDSSGMRTLTATESSNAILTEFDVFVINSQLMAKASILKINGASIPKSSLEIAPIVLIPTIPEKVLFDYSLAQERRDFGMNGKILSDIKNVFSSAPLLDRIIQEIDLSKFEQVKVSKSIDAVKKEINIQSGKSEDIRKWIEVNKLIELQKVDELNSLASILRSFDSSNIKTDTESFLAAFQIISVYQRLKSNFRKAMNYVFYHAERSYYESTIASFNTTRHIIKPKEDKKKGLIIEWPKAHEISNGQRDVLSFVTMLMKANRSFKKTNCILIIDEIFDYLDDANLISFQYFITTMIEEMKKQGKNFFPILMTHLDPLFFNHFCFNRHKIKVAYLKDVPFKSNANLLKLIKKREDPLIQTNIDKHHFHYYPTGVDISVDFLTLGLHGPWGDSQKFHQFIDDETRKYLKDQSDYDPLAICFSVRVKIESLIHSDISDSVKQQKFLDIHGTKKKLEYCEEIGHSVPESYYLLGIIYNDRLHWREGLDIIRPVAIKLENLTIKKLIRDLFLK